jgi:hypothetical protein
MGGLQFGSSGWQSGTGLLPSIFTVVADLIGEDIADTVATANRATATMRTTFCMGVLLKVSLSGILDAKSIRRSIHKKLILREFCCSSQVTLERSFIPILGNLRALDRTSFQPIDSPEFQLENGLYLQSA